eukprot:gene7824-biopygen14368
MSRGGCSRPGSSANRSWLESKLAP